MVFFGISIDRLIITVKPVGSPRRGCIGQCERTRCGGSAP